MSPAPVAQLDRRGRSTPPRRDLSYVLIADSDPGRVAAAMDAIAPHGCGALVARNGDEAIDVLRRFGAPKLVVLDLLLGPHDGFAVVETLRACRYDATGVVVWATERALREFALCRLSGFGVRVIRADAPPSVLARVIDSVMRRESPAHAANADDDTQAVDDEETLRDIQTRARAVCGAAGIAVYVGDSTTGFRSAGSWTPDEPMPQSLEYLPHVLKRVLETREPFVLDIPEEEPSNAVMHIGSVRGLVAVPIFNGDQVAGMICAFDVKPLSLDGAQMDALRALGRTAIPQPAAPERIVWPAVGTRSAEEHDAVRGAAATIVNRHDATAAVTREIARARREHSALALVLFDVAAPSAPIPAGARDPVDVVAAEMVGVIRGSDLAIRWDRFQLVLVLPGSTEAEARHVAERIHAAVRSEGNGVIVADCVTELANDGLEATVSRALQSIHG